MGPWRGWFALLALSIALSPATFAQSDTEPPVLVDFDFSPRRSGGVAGVQLRIYGVRLLAH
jgi:hypothetical protein